MSVSLWSAVPATATCNITGCGPLRYVETGSASFRRVQHEPHVYLIFWGSNWNKSPASEARADAIDVFESLSGSAYQGILTQYFDNTGHVSSQVDVTSYTDTSVAAPTEVTAAAIENEVTAAISANEWTDVYEANYIVMPANGTTYAEGAFDIGGQCAEHYRYDNDDVATYSFVPYILETEFEDQGCGKTSQAAEALTRFATHEYAESVLKPINTVWRATEIYFDAGEVGDLCGGGKLPSGLAVNSLYDNHLNKCAVEDLNPPHVLAHTDEESEVSEHGVTLNATVNPEGLETTYQFEYGPTTSYGTKLPASATSVGSGMKNVKVAQPVAGLATETTYHYRIKATNSTGTTYGEDERFTTSAWVQDTPDLDSGGKLYDVSCGSLTFCWAVGGTEDGRPYGERWNGKSWDFQEIHRDEHDADRLLGVSCVSSGWCMVVGAYGKLSPWAFAEQTDKGSIYGWSQMSVPYPSDFYGGKWELTDVSCVSASACVAVGWYPGPGASKKALIEKWDGTKWTAQSAPSPGNPTVLNGVSCSSESACTAVGSYVDTGGVTRTLAERWNGTSWSTQTTFNPSGADFSALEDVSCVSASFCMAAGRADDEAEEGLAERWTGSAWVSAPSLGGPITGVSCTSQTACTAVGETSTDVAQGEYWNGTAWAHKEPAIGTVTVRGVSCVGALACIAVSHPPEFFWNSYIWRLPSVPPTAETQPASSVSTTAATLNGSVNPKGFETQYKFEYGTSTSYGSTVPASPESIGSSTSAVAVKQTIGDLQAGRLYHYRVVATNGEKETLGADRTFETLPPTTLCKEASAHCDAPHRYPAGTTIEASLKSGTKFKFLSNFASECTNSTLNGQTSAETGAPLSLEVTAISLSGCTGGCTNDEFQNLPYGGTVEQSTSNNATVSVKSSGKGEPRMKFSSCTFGNTCTFGVSAMGLTLQGGNPGTMTAVELSLERKEGSKLLCGETGKINATYTISAPEPVYASRAAETLLCNEAADPCPAASAYSEGISFEAEGNLEYTFGFGKMTCQESTLAGTIEGGPAAQLPGTLSTWSLIGCGGCSTVKWLLPATTSLEAMGNGEGDLSANYLTIEFSGCPFGTSCAFEGNVHLEVHGGSQAYIQANNAALSRIGGSGLMCGSVMTINSGSWNVNTPKPLWISTSQS
jgi:hypothetical protein